MYFKMSSASAILSRPQCVQQCWNRPIDVSYREDNSFHFWPDTLTRLNSHDVNPRSVLLCDLPEQWPPSISSSWQLVLCVSCHVLAHLSLFPWHNLENVETDPYIQDNSIPISSDTLTWLNSRDVRSPWQTFIFLCDLPEQWPPSISSSWHLVLCVSCHVLSWSILFCRDYDGTQLQTNASKALR